MQCNSKEYEEKKRAWHHCYHTKYLLHFHCHQWHYLGGALQSAPTPVKRIEWEIIVKDSNDYILILKQWNWWRNGDWAKDKSVETNQWRQIVGDKSVKTNQWKVVWYKIFYFVQLKLSFAKKDRKHYKCKRRILQRQQRPAKLIILLLIRWRNGKVLTNVTSATSFGCIARTKWSSAIASPCRPWADRAFRRKYVRERERERGEGREWEI